MQGGNRSSAPSITTVCVGVALAGALPWAQPFTHRYTQVAESLAFASWSAVSSIVSAKTADTAPILTASVFVVLASILFLSGFLAARLLHSRLGGHPALFPISWLVVFTVLLYIAPLARPL